MDMVYLGSESVVGEPGKLYFFDEDNRKAYKIVKGYNGNVRVRGLYAPNGYVVKSVEWTDAYPLSAGSVQMPLF